MDFESIKSLVDAFKKSIPAAESMRLQKLENQHDLLCRAGWIYGIQKTLLERWRSGVCSKNMDIRAKFTSMGATKIFRIFNDVRSALNAFKWQQGLAPEVINLTFLQIFIWSSGKAIGQQNRKAKGYGNKDSFRIETIIDEICNNAIEHGKGWRSEYQCKIDIDQKQIEFDVINTSDPENWKPLSTSLNQRMNRKIHSERRGRGLSLIKMLSDELSVDCSKRELLYMLKRYER